MLADGRTAYCYTPSFLEALRDRKAVERAAIAVEKTQGPILMVAGQDDQLWPSSALAELGMVRLADKKHPFPDEILSYPDAGHGCYWVPGIPTTETAYEHPVMKVLLEMGGTPEGNAFAQRDSWARTLRFLKENLEERRCASLFKLQR